jgi:hypothetical protein
MCETNPISDGVARDGATGTWGNRAKRTQFAARYVARASCPWIGIMGGTPMPLLRQPRTKRARRTQFPTASRGTGATGGVERGAIVQNEPNFATRRAGTSGAITRNKANCSPGRCRARTPNPRRAEGVSCETKPISRPRRGGRGQRDAGRGPIVQNEANLAGRVGSRRAKCAKQTQFPAVPGGPPSALDPRTTASRRTDCAKRTQFRRVGRGRRGERRGRIVRNEANFHRRAGRAAEEFRPDGGENVVK